MKCGGAARISSFITQESRISNQHLPRLLQVRNPPIPTYLLGLSNLLDFPLEALNFRRMKKKSPNARSHAPRFLLKISLTCTLHNGKSGVCISAHRYRNCSQDSSTTSHLQMLRISFFLERSCSCQLERWCNKIPDHVVGGSDQVQTVGPFL